MDEYELREVISQQFAQAIGGGPHSFWERLPYVNKIAGQLAPELRWATPDEINRRVKEAVLQYA